MSGTSMPAGAGYATPGDPGRGPSSLAAAFLVAFALHAAALLAIAFLHLSPPAPPGEQPVTVDLAPLMSEAVTQATAEQQQAVETAAEATPVETPVEEAAEPPPPPEVAEVKPDEVPAEAPPQSQTLVEAPPDAPAVEPESQVITSTAEQAEPLAPPPPVAAQEPKPVEPEKPKPDLAKLKAEREAKLKAIREEKRREELVEARREERLKEIREEKLREAKLKAAREAKAREQARAGSAARDSAAASSQNSAGRAAAGSDPNALRQWTGAISSAIHGRMNSSAALGTSGGVAVVRFTVLRSGQVSGAGLARSSGVGQIDSAALSAVRGSMPAAPPGVTQPSLTVTIPLNYRVR